MGATPPLSPLAPNSFPTLPVIRGVRFAVGANSGTLPRSCRIDNFQGTGPARPSDIPTASTLGLIVLGIGLVAVAWRFLGGG